jgi:SAM-dependent methyltransferase
MPTYPLQLWNPPMQTLTIQRQYDEVIAPHYDQDPQSLIGDSLDRAVAQLRKQHVLASDAAPLRVLDLGVGTGRFLQELRDRSQRPVLPSGLDLSHKMIDIARARIPDLVAVIENAANFDAHFPDESFDLISTHFITGFVPMAVLAPKIRGRLAPGGYWSFIGGTKAGFPELQRQANTKALRWLLGGKSLAVDDLVCNPTDGQDVIRTLEGNGFTVRQCESFMPQLHFADLNAFLEFGYWGGWLTPFVEDLGLHQANHVVRLLLNLLIFPARDHHAIEIVLAQKMGSD